MTYRNVVIIEGHVAGEESHDGHTWRAFCSPAAYLKIGLMWDEGQPADVATLVTIQDAHGGPGRVPENGLDWMAVIDSSAPALAAMVEAAEAWREAPWGPSLWPWEALDVLAQPGGEAWRQGADMIRARRARGGWRMMLRRKSKKKALDSSPA